MTRIHEDVVTATIHIAHYTPYWTDILTHHVSFAIDAECAAKLMVSDSDGEHGYTSYVGEYVLPDGYQFAESNGAGWLVYNSHGHHCDIGTSKRGAAWIIDYDLPMLDNKVYMYKA